MKEISLDVLGIKIAGLRSKHAVGERCLCLHGWMDNAASFIPLERQLKNMDIVALDLPGHGKSGHFPVGHQYHLIDQAAFILSAAESLGWHSFNLIGHSLGGCIAPFVAVAAPEQVTSVVMLEALGPMTETAQQLPNRVRQATKAMYQNHKKQSRLYTNISDAVKARLEATNMHESNARLIVERNIAPTNGGYRWSFDSKIRIPSSYYMTEEHVIEILKAMTQPTLCVLAADGYLVNRKGSKARLEAIQRLKLIDVPGHHHMHMDDPESSAEAVKRFLQNK